MDGGEPPRADPAVADLTLEQIRIPATILLLGGCFLLLIGFSINSGLTSVERYLTWALMTVGVSAFLIAGQAVGRRRIPVRFVDGLRQVSQFLGVSVGQLAMLALAPCFALLAYIAAGDMLLARHGIIATVSWLLALGLAIAGCWAPEERRFPKIGRGELIFTAALLIAAFLLRGVNLAGIPDTLSGDEAASGLVSLSFNKGETDNLFTFGWFSFPSLYFVIQGLGLRLLGQTTEGLRISSALGGALAVVAVYWLARVMFDRLTGSLAAILLAVSHYHIHMSRIGLNNIWDSFFGVMSICGLYHGWKTGRRSSFIIAGAALGLGLYFYVTIRALPIIFLLWAGAAYWRDRDTFRQRLPGLLLAAFIALIVVLPFALQAIRHWDQFMAPLARVSIFSEDWLQQEMTLREQSGFQIITGQMLATAKGFIRQPLTLLYDPGAPLLLSGAAALFLIGIIWTLIHFDLKYLLLILPMLVVIITGGFTRHPPSSQRFVMAMPLVAILVAMPLSLAVQWLQQLWPRAKVILLLGVGIVLAILVFVDLNYYFNEVPEAYVLGGENTETATQIAYYLRDQEDPQQKVYFFGLPRMGYFSFATIQFLAPKMDGEDVKEPLETVPRWRLQGPTLFIFLPERLSELDLVRGRHPNGIYREFYADGGQILFAAYEVLPGSPG